MAEQYLPLYRKYRPQEFGDLVGQDNLVKAFTNAINTGKIAHAYLFCGPRGTGKTSSARILAKSLNCENGPTLKPCGKCPSCMDILNGSMIDVIEMDAASNRSVEDAQNIIDKIHYAPVNGKYKIFIIDEVHMISKTAFNALLKTLEEPPENVIFILATTEPQKVLETIISRCQRFDFRRITVDDIAKRLDFIANKEGIKINKDAVYTIAKNSQGGMRDALALLDQVSVLDTENEITPELVNQMLCKVDIEILYNLAQSVFDKSVENSVKIINEVYSKGNEPLQIIENLIQYYRNLTIIKTCKDLNYITALTLLSDETVKLMKKQASTVSIDEIAKTAERLTYYYKEIKYTNNRYLWLELCFIDIASGQNNNQSLETNSIQPTKEINPIIKKDNEINVKTAEEEIIKNIETPEQEIEKSTQSESGNPVPQKDTLPVKQDFQKQNNSADDWKGLLDCIESPPSRSFFATFAKPVEMGESKIVITFKDENFANKAKENPKIEALKKAGLKFYNSASIEIEILVGAKSSNLKSSQTEQTQQKPSILSQKTTTKPETISKQETNKNTNEYQKTFSEETDTDSKNESPLNYEYNNYTDQVKMVKDLFDAKIFD